MVAESLDLPSLSPEEQELLMDCVSGVCVLHSTASVGANKLSHNLYIIIIYYMLNYDVHTAGLKVLSL